MCGGLVVPELEDMRRISQTVIRLLSNGEEALPGGYKSLSQLLMSSEISRTRLS